ncbi:MAG: aldehyde dehydrogenase family protein, partial [Myxococcota bacterium]|nr:aldehyde dehydrogenase family protein [Myxococcota bacterium]
MDTAALDAKLQRLAEQTAAWTAKSIAQRIEYLEALIQGTLAVADRQVRAACKAKGVEYGSGPGAEDYFGGPVVQIRTMRLLKQSLESLQAHGRIDLPKNAISTRPDGTVVAQVFPTDLVDSLLLAGFEAEIWMEDGVTENNLTDHQGAIYRTRASDGGVALVLGAGNVASIGPLDVVHKLFVENQVCLLKFNPVNDYTGPFFEEAFAPLIREGFVQTAYGGADVGAYLCQHDGVDDIHVTGSDKTHDAIVFGTGEDGAARKAANQPINAKTITSELGNVSGVIVVPGSWTDKALRFQAENIASQLANNNGFNCNAIKVLILKDDWPQKREFLDMIRAVLATLPRRPAYYPGAETRYDKVVQQHPKAEAIGHRSDGVLPYTIIAEVDANNPDEICFREESFCGVFAQTSLGGANTPDYLDRAVAFCNDTLWGTLNVSIIVDPRTENRFSSEIDDAISRLNFGTVSINHWASLGYGLGCTAWGAFPGHEATDIQSGSGKVHNTYLFERAQKNVIRGPFVVFPKPPWFVTHGRSQQVGRRIADLE